MPLPAILSLVTHRLIAFTIPLSLNSDTSSTHKSPLQRRHFVRLLVGSFTCSHTVAVGFPVEEYLSRIHTVLVSFSKVPCTPVPFTYGVVEGR